MPQGAIEAGWVLSSKQGETGWNSGVEGVQENIAGCSDFFVYQTGKSLCECWEEKTVVGKKEIVGRRREVEVRGGEKVWR